MPEFDQQRIEVANELRRVLAVENQLTPAQARALVRGLQTTWRVPTIQWSEEESKSQLQDARRLIHAAETYAEIEGVSSPNAIFCYRRAAEILEWLARSEDSTKSIAPIEMFAAGAYQLGGLPAMAAGILKQCVLEHDGLKLYSKFFQGDFDGVVKSA